MSHQAPAQPYGFASDFLTDDTPPPELQPPAPPGGMSVDQRLFALETGQVAILRELKELKPVVKKLRLESQVLRVIKSTAFVAMLTALGNVLVAQVPGSKVWVPVILEWVRVTQ